MTPDCTITARSSAETVAAAPYVIGFHPTDSVVVIGAVGDMVTFGVRYDLPPPGEGDEADMARLIARQPLRHVTVLGYGPPGQVTPALLALVPALERAGVRVADTIRVTGGRWWSYRCQDTQCCPPEGRSVDDAAAAKAVYQGRVALPDRQALVARVSPVTGAGRAEMAAATERARARLTDLAADDLRTLRAGGLLRRSGRAAIREAEATYRAGGVPSADEVAWLGVLLVERAVLGYALDRCGGEEEWRIRLWTDVLRRVEPGYVPGPACLLAFAAWRAGEGALARVAIDRALAEDPGHRTAGILDDLLCSGIGPHALITLSPPGGLRGRRPGRTGGGRRSSRGTRRRSL
jgi:hypothetical protein